MRSGPDIAALERHLARAADALCYPPAALRLRQTGEVRLRFCAEPSGRPRDVSLESGSGSGLLDRAALDCVLQRASPLPVREGCYAVRVRFGPR